MTGIANNINNILKYKEKNPIFTPSTHATPLAEALFGSLYFFAGFSNKTTQNVAVIATFADTMHNTPAMPLNDAQIGGFFYARRKRA